MFIRKKKKKKNAWDIDFKQRKKKKGYKGQNKLTSIYSILAKNGAFRRTII